MGAPPPSPGAAGHPSGRPALGDGLGRPHLPHQLGGGTEGQPGQGPVRVADHARGVDHEDRAPVEAHGPEHPVGPPHRLVPVGQEGHGQSPVGLEALMALDVLGAYGEHRGPHLLELADVGLVVPQLLGAQDRKSTRLNSSHTVIYTLSLTTLFRSALMALDVLGAYGEHRGPHLLELADVGLVVPQLLGAHGGLVARVEDQHHRPAPVVGQRVAAPSGPRQAEAGSEVPHSRPPHQASTASRMASGMSKLDHTCWTSSWSSRASMTRSTLRAVSRSSRGTEVVGTMARSADWMGRSAPSRTARTRARSVGAHVTRQLSPSSARSSAPASATSSMSWSSSTLRGSRTWPLRSNCQDTEPGSAIEPPPRVKMVRTSAPVRLRLSVRHSTMTATPAGA